MDFKPLATDLGTLAANAASYSGATAVDFIGEFTNGFLAQQAKLGGAKAAPVEFVNNGFAVGKDIAVLTENQKAIAFVSDLQITENDLASGKWLPGVMSLVADYSAFKALVSKS